MLFCATRQNFVSALPQYPSLINPCKPIALKRSIFLDSLEQQFKESVGIEKLLAYIDIHIALRGH
jgi:hypothetical protein